MRMLRVISTMDPLTGGPSQGIRNSIPALQKLGVESEVVSFDMPDASFLRNEAIKVHALGPSYSPWQYCPKFIPWLNKNYDRFDLIIVHGLWKYNMYGSMKGIFKLRKKGYHNVPKIYIMPHGMLDPYFQKAPERKLKAIRNNLYWKFIENEFINRADGILFTSEEERRLSHFSFPNYHPQQLINIGYGIIPPPEFVPKMKEAFQQKCTGVENKPFILFLSRIHQKKGVDNLLAAYDKISKEKIASKPLPDLVIAGPGIDTPFGKKIKKSVAESSTFKNKVFFPGMLKGDAKWGALYSCEAFILPSHQENFGIAVAEALACTKPVLITDKVNIWQEIKSSNSGYVTNDDFSGTFSLLSEWINSNSNEKSIMSKNARKCFEEYFESDFAAQKFLEGLQQSQKSAVEEKY
ncbi:MAG: glycosyltransferase [Candidatus Cyclobacteriaceae bacterium M3_2C_046]